ncbi:MAG: dihydrodipicolinate reductase [Gemmatimonadota bacterium]|nr:dihydrodipicolinate reductase [Gemmatimonadota bacterium]
MSNPIRILHIGLGPLGQMLGPYLTEKDHLQVVGAVDADPEKSGRDLGAAYNLDRPLNVVVEGSLDAGMMNDADVAVVTTVSDIRALYPTLEQAMEGGLNVVSTCEELAYPWDAEPELARRVDDLAKANRVSILGTGVNPGFLMDFLPVATTAVCRNVDSILIERIQDASRRRLPFRQKIGAGLSVDAFQKRVRNRQIRHVGLTQSMQMIASRLGWSLDRTEDIVEPVIARTEVRGKDWSIQAGRATGVNQTGRGFADNREVLTLVFRAAVGESQPRDRIRVFGTPEVDLTVAGGINGDVATCSIVTNAIPVIHRAPPGLRTMVDIAPISAS